MKVFSADGSVLMEVKSFDRNGNNIEFTGTVMGAMPVKGSLSPDEARKAFGLMKGKGLWFFLMSFIFRKSAQS
ncbi:MAG TPA: hypothetical protein DCX08_11685 [Porticoccaceae bacterium]|jgi:hypothetical protein|nr:hypothetical protein [Porticoccaceae bacterium]